MNQKLEEIKKHYEEINSLVDIYEKASKVYDDSEINEKKQIMKTTRDKILKLTFHTKQILKEIEHV